MYRDIRFSRIDFDKVNALNRLPKTAWIAEEYYGAVKHTSVTTRYATVGKMRYRDVLTGEEFTDYRTMGHDAPRKAGEVTDELFSKIGNDRYYRELELIESSIDNTWQGLGWS